MDLSCAFIAALSLSIRLMWFSARSCILRLLLSVFVSWFSAGTLFFRSYTSFFKGCSSFFSFSSIILEMASSKSIAYPVCEVYGEVNVLAFHFVLSIFKFWNGLRDAPLQFYIVSCKIIPEKGMSDAKAGHSLSQITQWKEKNHAVRFFGN